MPRRKRSTWGCVQRVRPGVYRLRWLEDTPEGRKRRSETLHDVTRKQADRRLAEIRVRQDSEEAGITVREVWERYVLPDYQSQLRKGKKRPQTISQYINAWNTHVGPRWGDVAVASLRPKEMQDWLLTISNGMGGKSLILLRAIAAKAEFLEIVDRDVMRRTYQLAEKRSRDNSVPDLAGLERIWAVCRGHWLEPAFLLCAHGGMRVGEAVGAQVGDIEWRREAKGLVAVVHVTRQVTEENKIEPPKYRSTRYTAIPDPWASRLRELTDGLRQGAVWMLDDDATDLDVPPLRNRVKYQWAKLMRGTEWQGLLLQKLRPAFETYMHWERGVPMERLRKMMGHKSVATTQRYDRPDEGTLMDAMIETVLSTTT